ncbi:MAG: recombination mediator RecR [Candidatus Izemoplasmatales bacterium]|nr:recombination mediator RecR [Candidatus Izemoplasmatales bacterium]MDD4069128.1 recombination mediator RecR [Candidatus Izemoplasmatales bacterium]MDY0140121.1 recombination mediator RecR [Candidatus Izemoplasmatales bacterium]
MSFPKSLENLVEQLKVLPGVGRKTAERYALHIINKLDQEQSNQIADAIQVAKNKIKHCSICGNLTDDDVCDICQSNSRDESTILVVENSKDVFSIENANQYKGLYHVLNGVLSPMDGMGIEDINLDSLWKRITDDKVREIIIATSSTPEGETTALYISRVLKDIDVTVSRIGYGVPVGLNLEYADDLTLSKAIENRKKY